MKFLVVPIEELKEFDVDWEYRRTNVTGTHALIHENLYNKYFQPMLLNLDSIDGEQQEIEYPYPVYEGIDLDNMLESPEWNKQVSIVDSPVADDNNDTYIDTTEIPVL